MFVVLRSIGKLFSYKIVTNYRYKYHALCKTAVQPRPDTDLSIVLMPNVTPALHL